MTDQVYQVEDPDGREKARLSGGVPFVTVPGLHVPGAPHRPGDEPRFARFTHQPGDLACPAPEAPCDQLKPHGSGLVRVLDDEASALGPWDPKLPPEFLRKGLQAMVQTRAFDERLMTMQRQGRLSFYCGSAGEEAVSVAAGMALRPDDLLFPSYRQPGLFLVRGMSLLEMMCQCIGNQGDNAKGRQMPVHYTFRKGNLVSVSSPVGTQFPQAVGAAMASAYRSEDTVTAVWIGEGTAAQGDFHYALNFASVYLPPVVLNIINNQWAISTHRNVASGGKTFAARAEAYGLPGIRADGNDFLAVYAVMQWAVERARRGAGPTLIEFLTYRKGAHSSSDDPSRYRPGDEARLWPGGDPVDRLATHLKHLGEWSDEQHEELLARSAQEMTTKYKKAEKIGSLAQGPWDPPETIVENVYRTLPAHLRRQQEQLRKAS